VGPEGGAKVAVGVTCIPHKAFFRYDSLFISRPPPCSPPRAEWVIKHFSIRDIDVEFVKHHCNIVAILFHIPV
jgi:hypothetical protein